MNDSVELLALIDELRRELTVLKAENAALKAENAELRRRLGLNSSNSSKPPSSDGPGKPRCDAKRNKSLRGKSGRASGGQKGHKGKTLAQVAKPDKTERHHLEACPYCAARLDHSNVVGVEKRQVFDILAPKLEVTEHQSDICKCGACGKISKAPFPEGVNAPAVYGPQIKAAAIYLGVQHLIPEDRLSCLMADLFAAPTLCPATIVAWTHKKAEDLAPVQDAIKDRLKATPVRHLDETGFRIGGKTEWLHTVSSTTLTHYVATEKRGDIPTFLRDDASCGTIVHDHFKPYYKQFADLKHALCNAHHLRELKALVEHDEEAWATEMSDFLLTLKELVDQAKGKDMSELPPSLLEPLEHYYDGLIDDGLKFHEALPPLPRQRKTGRPKRRPGHNLLRRLRDFKRDVLRFAHDFAVPFTNNLAEQDIRMMKVRMKISGGFRSKKGADVFATMRGIISTARKQQWNILDTLAALPQDLIDALKPA